MQKTGIVIPCYNEAERLNVDSFIDFLKGKQHIDLLFVNDGSTDGTINVLKKLKEANANHIDFLDIEQNCGKAEVVRKGMLKLFGSKQYSYIGFWDADLATPLEEVDYLLRFSESENKKMILASRLKRLGSSVQRKTSRHIFGRVFSTFASNILKLPVYDSQCGAKLFHSSTEEIFKEPFITKWIFDVEILARYRNKHGVANTLEDVVEVPVNAWQEIGGSKLKLKHLLKVPMELIRISKKYNA